MELVTIEKLQKDSNGYIIFNNNIRLNIDDIPVQDVLIVEELTEHRFYLVSEVAYGTPIHADLIVIFNNVNNPFYLPIGTKVKLPDLQYIQSKIILHNQQNAEYENSNLVQKNKLTSKLKQGTNVQRSDGRLIYKKTN